MTTTPRECLEKVVSPDLQVGQLLSNRDSKAKMQHANQEAIQRPQHPRQHSIGTTESLPLDEDAFDSWDRISVVVPVSPGWSSCEQPGRSKPKCSMPTKKPSSHRSPPKHRPPQTPLVQDKSKTSKDKSEDDFSARNTCIDSQNM